MATSQSAVSIPKLRAELTGHVIAAGDLGYDEARSVFNGGIDRRPAVVIRATDASEVAYVIALARDTGLELAIRGGGHSSAGDGVTDGGIVLDLSLMKALEIDPDSRVAWAEAGLTTGEVTSAAGKHGLAIGFGDTGSVGIAGLTLGGGIGLLVRKHGLTIDNLLATEIVTADGQLLKADESNHPQLFWALRGGGGNFGVATRFQFRLQPVDTVTGGMLILPATPETIESFIAASEQAPEELSTIANVMPLPPMPFVPEEHHGKLGIFAILVYAGPVEDGERAVAPLRALATPYADLVRPMPYPGVFPPEEGEYRPIFCGRSMFLDKVDRGVAEEILAHLRNSTAMMSVAQLRVLGGAMARVPADATAFAHRTSRIMTTVAAISETVADVPAHEKWVSDFAAALRPTDPGVYVNFLADEGEERVRAAYPGATWDRLAAIKDQYDPTNLFRRNQNIPPAAA
jgi:FAD/FMN-containing dehydrogenase